MSPVNLNDERITYFGQTDARGKKINFGIKAKDRTRHVYVIGKTGMGKSTLLENMAVQDIKNGEGMAFIDPHGKTADLLLEYVTPERMKDVVYFAPFDTDFPISFNVLESVDPDKRHLVVSGLMSTFKKIWQDAWSARMEYILTNTLLALLEYPGATLLGVNRMLAEKDFRKDVIDHITDISVKNFWVKEFANYTERMAAEAVPAIQNKIGQFTANALIRNMIGQANSSFNIRELMDDRKILIINLSKGKIGESNANLLGGMLITKIYLAAMSRADVTERTLKTLPNFYLFVDEFQSFANESFADILSEARKYKLNLTIAHQYIEQMEEEVRAAVFGNVGTMIIFRVGAYDAEILEKEFAPTFTAEDIVNLGFTQIYLKLMIDGIGSAPFSATSLPPIAQPETSIVKEVIAASREQFAHKRAEVEAAIIDWHKPMVKPPPAPKAAPTAATPTRTAAGTPKSNAPATPTTAPVVQTTAKPVAATPNPKVVAPPPQSKTAAPSQLVTKPAIPMPTIQKPVEQKSEPVKSAPSTTSQTSSAPNIEATKVVATPFKAAFENLDDERVSIPALTPAPTPISLSSLAPKSPSSHTSHSPHQNSQKTPTPKNVADLKSALASVMNANKSIDKGVNTSTLQQNIHVERTTNININSVKTPEPKKEPSKEAPIKESLKEVPKEVLEKLLKLD